jgi:hypothetical protein
MSLYSLFYNTMLAQVYGSGKYNSDLYGGTGNGSGSGLTNTGIAIAAVVTAAALILLIAMIVRVWRRPAKPSSADDVTTEQTKE